MTHSPSLAACVLVALLASPTTAAISVDIVSVDNSALLTGYNTFDFQMNTPDSDWVSAALLLNVSAGSIYQDPNGAEVPLHPFFFSLYPTVEFDTYVGVLQGSIAGGGGDVGGDAFEFSTTELDVSFFNIDKTDIGSFPIGRITLSDDAVGTWSLVSTTAVWQESVELIGTISQGVMAIDAEASAAAALAAYLNSMEYRRTLPRPTYGREPIDLTSLLSPVIPFPEVDEPLAVTGDADTTLPEPGTVALLGFGGLALLRRR